MSQPIGGQAVLEGVMMRGPSNWAVAVRKPNGQIAEVCRPIESVMKRHWVFRLPILRGVIALGESLAIGFRALSISAQYAAQEEGAEADCERLPERDHAADDRQPEDPVPLHHRLDRAADLRDLAVGLADRDSPVRRAAHHHALEDGLPSNHGCHSGLAGAGFALGALGALEALLEPLDPAAGVYELLLARIERVAVRADLDMELGLRRPRLE